jgi:cobaltochelatase CobN
LKIINISIQSECSNSLNAPAKELSAQGLDFDIFHADYYDLENDPLLFQRLIAETKTADFVLIRCMADPYIFKRYEEYKPILDMLKGYVMIFTAKDIQMVYRDSFKGPDRDFALFCAFMTYRGPENERGILLEINKLLGGPFTPVPDPIMPKLEGIYHPDCPDDTSLSDYMCRLVPERPTAGLIFSQGEMTSMNVAHINALITGLEEAGLNVIPTFFSHLSEPSNGEGGMPAHLKKYMMDGDKSRIDLLLMCISSSYLIFQKDQRGIQVDESRNFYISMTGVPVFQVMCVHGPYHDLEGDAQGLRKHDLTIMVVRPELDGQIITVPIGRIPEENSYAKRIEAIPDRVDHVVRMAKNYIELRRKPASERKIAILMYQPRENSASIGCAGGFDVPESLCRILKRMHEDGYTVDHIPEESKDLINEILDGVTNDMSFIPPEVVRERAVDMVSKTDYLKVFDGIEDFNRKRLRKSWGEPVGEVSVQDEKIVIPGLMNGNIFIGYQPIRCWATQSEALYHDPVVPAPHSYLQYYRWLKDVFKADAVVHMGTHGTLEWLPGKSVGLSNKCDPDMILNALPNLYPFCIDDPGEGIQGKRRTEAVLIGHLNPTMARADTYDELSDLEIRLQEYFILRNSCSQERKDILISEIMDASKKVSLFSDLNIPDDVSVEGFVDYIDPLHDYLADLKDALIRNGLHILGHVPEGDHLDEAIYSLTRLKNGDVPSLRTSLGETMGYDVEKCISGPSETTDGELNSMILDKVDSELNELLINMRLADYDKSKCMSFVESRYPNISESFRISLEYSLETVIPNLLKTSNELDNFMRYLDGHYVPPGPSGAPTRGNARILPTGRNFYGIDPDSIPTPACWEIGRKMADQMLSRYVEEKGAYPKEIGMVIWATDTMKTNGDDIAYILWLMGLKPVWSKHNGQVNGLEVIPLEELGRPRIDVTVRITGLFRDTFPNLIDMFNDAVDIVAELDEGEEDNYLAANFRKDMVESMAKGLPIDECRKSASSRVFGSPPGSYGAGVDIAIGTGDWKDTKDIADIYTTWSSYVYGHGMYGEFRKDDFVKRFSKVSVTIKNMPDRENDIMGMDEVYNYMGGMNAFTRAYGNQDAVFFIGDDSDPDRTKLRTVAEECKFIFRSKILNPKYISGLKEHGYRGAIELSNMTEYMIGWDGTSAAIDDWMYDSVVEKILMDEDTKKWLEEDNPFAMMEMINRLNEAIDRGLWDASDEMKEKLNSLYLDAEEAVEGATDRYP